MLKEMEKARLKAILGDQINKGEGSCEGSGSLDEVNEDEVLKENFRGLSDIDEYNSDELPYEYDSEDYGILKDDFVTFKLPKRMEI